MFLRCLLARKSWSSSHSPSTALLFLPIMSGFQTPSVPRSVNRKRRRPAGNSRNASTAAAVQMKPNPSNHGVEASAAPIAHLSLPDAATSKTFSALRFTDLVQQNKISQKIASNIKFEFCTQVQAATIDVGLSGADILARAKTGTGKTVAFLLPSIQQLSSIPLPTSGKISILVISPTRELAQQIANEAMTLTTGLPIKVQCIVGGTNINVEKRRLTQERCDILVATPGRFMDHVKNYGLANNLSHVRTLVLDEADRLLDEGFRNETIAIINSLPDRKIQPRQTLLFSATVSDGVKKIASLALLPAHKYISTISDDEQNTHEHVKQEYIIVPLADSFALTAQFLSNCITESRAAGEETKVIAFFPTARAAGLMYEVFSVLEPRLPIPMFEIHSRMSQPARTRATESFRKAASAVLFSSDVTARGMDFIGIRWVLQVGIPMNAEQYIHRLGRTARAGKAGSGLLILSPSEAFFLKNPVIQGLPLVVHPQSQIFQGPHLDVWRQRTQDAMTRTSDDSKAKAYTAWMGFYKDSIKAMRWSSEQLVENANEYVLDTLQYIGEGDGRPPAIAAKTVGKMRLKGIPGLNVVKGPTPARRTGAH